MIFSGKIQTFLEKSGFCPKMAIFGQNSPDAGSKMAIFRGLGLVSYLGHLNMVSSFGTIFNDSARIVGHFKTVFSQNDGP